LHIQWREGSDTHLRICRIDNIIRKAGLVGKGARGPSPKLGLDLLPMYTGPEGGGT
jgi:hypothetical protein